MEVSMMLEFVIFTIVAGAITVTAAVHYMHKSGRSR